MSPRTAKLIRRGNELHLIIEAPVSILINIIYKTRFHATIPDVPPGRYRVRVF